MRKQKLLAALLALVMVMTLLPLTALASATTAGTGKQYLSVGTPDTGKQPGWYMSDEANVIELYKVESGTTGTKIDSLEELVSGNQYIIFSTTGTRILHNWQAFATAQDTKSSGDTIEASDTYDIWTITKSGEGYTISTDSYNSTLVYLTADTYVGTATTISNYNELQLSSTNQAVFNITEAGSGSGSFYITVGEDAESGQEGNFDGFGTGLRYALFNDGAKDDTWVFTGGANVAGGFEQTKGEHNFTRHFEEYVRWTMASSNQTQSTLQRYVVNTGAKGRTLSDVMEDWEGAVKNYHPEAVLYMAGPEDYNDDGFEGALKEFIKEALELRDGAGYAVVLTPINDGSDGASKLNETIRRVLLTFQQSGDKDRICLVDIYNALGTNSDYYTTGGYLTEKGHLEVGRELARVTYGSANNFPSTNDARNLTVLSGAPAVFDHEVMPTAIAGNGSLKVTVQGAEGPYMYELRLGNGETVKGTAQNSPFAILGLPTSGTYTLITRADGGNTQLVTVKGQLEEGSNSTKDIQDVSSGSPQEKLQQAFAGDKQMTWLFIGDSITHGAQHTHGYDSISELFDKFLEAAGRGTDVVINVGVSGASAYSNNAQLFRNTIGNLNERVTVFGDSGLDVATIQLGTNDTEDATSYKNHIEEIMNAVWQENEGAIIILRSPTAAPGGSYSNKANTYAPSLRELAEKYPDKVIYDDQHTAVAAAMSTYTWIRSDNQYIFGDANVHPGPVGHLIMLHQFLRACGIYTEDNPMTNLKYKIITDTGTSSALTVDNRDNEDGTHTLTVTRNPLSGSFGELTLTAEGSDINETFEVSASSINGLSLTVPDGDYTVTLSGVTSGGTRNRSKTSPASVSAGTFTPPAITDEDLERVTVTVTCTNKFDQGEDKEKTYKLSESGGAQILDIEESGGSYTCDVEVEYSVYISAFGNGHNANNETHNETITFEFIDNIWVPQKDNVQIAVECDAVPTLDDSTIIEGLTVTVLNTADGSNNTVTLLSTDFVKQPVNKSGSGYDAHVIVNHQAIAERFANEQGISINPVGENTDVTFTYNTDDDTWTAEPNTITISFTPATTPVTPPAPPSTATQPSGDDETNLPDTDIPLNPTPDDDTDVDEGDTPLAPAPEDKGDTDISDTDTPLDSTPKTGDASLSIAILWSIFSLSAIGFVSVMLSMKKSGKHTK